MSGVRTFHCSPHPRGGARLPYVYQIFTLDPDQFLIPGSRGKNTGGNIANTCDREIAQHFPDSQGVVEVDPVGALNVAIVTADLCLR